MMPPQTCAQCPGTALVNGRCVGHLDGEELSVVAKRVRDGAPLDARNVVMSAVALARFLGAVKAGDEDLSRVGKVDFGNARFTGFADFRGVVFDGEARFTEATFEKVRFASATFNAGARFRDTTFNGVADFRDARFESNAQFSNATFGEKVTVERAVVKGSTSFSKTEFLGSAFFGSADFHGTVRFDRAGCQQAAKFNETRFRGHADFRRASVAGDASYLKAEFKRLAMFEGARFGGAAIFKKGVFVGPARFHSATFAAARFADAHFHEGAIFDSAEFRGATSFYRAHFDSAAGFRSTRFRAQVAFGSAVFTGDATFEYAHFDSNARLGEARFDGETRFNGVHCGQRIMFNRVSFRASRELGRMTAERVYFDGADFQERIRIEVAAESLSAKGTVFAGGTQLRVDGADIVLEDADFVRQSTLLGLRSRPRLISLRGAQVSPLALSSVDLRQCRFFGTHGLDSMRVEASCLWPCRPARWGVTRRQTIAEEHRWRDEHLTAGRMRRISRRLRGNPRARWQDDEMRRFGNVDRPLTADQIATLYRSLRKGREDSKDAAGAGDLYYGEMEMRRHADTHSDGPWRRPLGEKPILTSYWIASGYGLRATRALACLSLVLLAGSGLLLWFGFSEPTYDYGRSLIFAAESSLSLLRPPDAVLTPGGEVVQIFLRLLGPLFFGLALLAMRARVKR